MLDIVTAHQHQPAASIHSGEDTGPGVTALTRTPPDANESANTRDSDICAAFVTE